LFIHNFEFGFYLPSQLEVAEGVQAEPLLMSVPL